MGVCIYSNYQGSKKCYGGYGSFFRLRYNIAKAVMGKMDFGYYEQWLKTDNKTDKEILHFYCDQLRKYGDAFYNFITQSDVNGHISSKECKKIYDAISDSKEDFMFGYDAYEKLDIKQFMLECYKHRACLRWE